MNRFARVLPWLAAALLVVGCGFDGGTGANAVESAREAGGMLVDTGSLPDGHPPIPGHHLGLPEGHPPVLPEGHPPLLGESLRCPRSASGPGLQPDEGAVRPSAGVELIST